MNKPKTGEQFLDVLAKSGLLPADRVRELADGATAKELADRLTASGHITDYQARHLLAGRAEGYFLGPYKLLDRLGKGKNGQVYLAEHTRMRRRVAVKVLQAETAQSHEGVRRFEREAQAAAALQHPHIVQAFDFGHVGKIHYLVMEYVEGRNLLQMAAEDGRMAPRKAAALMKQAAEALHFAHEAGVVHRDVKPSNLMVSAAGRLTLLDLGLALYHGDDENLTRGGAVLGVAAFIAPEQATDSHAVDGRADVYGLGATFWLMVTGKTPPVYGDFAPPPPRT
nr:serine/threonine protein kinase [Fimbriiglobus sp.]